MVENPNTKSTQNQPNHRKLISNSAQNQSKPIGKPIPNPTRNQSKPKNQNQTQQKSISKTQQKPFRKTQRGNRSCRQSTSKLSSLSSDPPPFSLDLSSPKCVRVCGFGIWERQGVEEGDGETWKKERWRDFNRDNVNKIIINKRIKNII